MEQGKAMSCEEFRDWGPLYVFQELDRHRRMVFEKHIRDCPDCRKDVEEIRAVWRTLDALPVESPSQEQNETVLRMAKRRNRSAPGRSGLKWLWGNPRRTTAFAFAVLFLALGLTGIRLIVSRGMERPYGSDVLWGDTFFYRLDEIDRTISTVQSGELSVYAFSKQDRWADDEIPVADDTDLIVVKNELEQLQRSIVGI